MKVIFTYLLIIISASTYGQYDPDHYTEKASRLLIKDDTLHHYYDIREDGVYMYASPAAKAAGQPEFVVFWSESRAFLDLMHAHPTAELVEYFRQKGTQPLTMSAEKGCAPRSGGGLKGKKIAIDPGHLGGSMEMAEIEDRFIKIKPYIEFNEGNLTMAVAQMLANMLRKEGAEVMITRKGAGYSGFDLTFDEWLRDSFDVEVERQYAKGEIDGGQKKWWLNNATDKQIYHGIFKHADFRARARKINAFCPDVAIVIHFNADERNRRNKEGYLIPTTQNWNMAFVPGSFMKSELDSTEDRLEFVRLLLSDDIEESVRISDLVVEALVQLTEVPAVPDTADIGYLKNASIFAGEKGVYSRNLSLTRMIKAPVVYGESFYQDHYEESIRLNDKDLKVKGIKAPKRIKPVAEAYFNALKSYFQP